MGHWVMLDLAQAGPNVDAIGARIEVSVGGLRTTRERSVGGGHIGGQLGWIHVGLGSATEVRVRITWPDGEVGPWFDLPADGFWILERDSPQPRGWTPPAE
jgi:hypothetical protein